MALGKSAEAEYKDGTHKISEQLIGEVRNLQSSRVLERVHTECVDLKCSLHSKLHFDLIRLSKLLRELEIFGYTFHKNLLDKSIQ